MSIDALMAASAVIGLPLDNPLRGFVEEVVEDGDEPPEYVFIGAVGRSRVTAKQLAEFRYCDPAITSATGVVVDHLKPAEWRKARRLLMAAKTHETLGPEAGVTGTARTRLLHLLRTTGISVIEEGQADVRDHFLAWGDPIELDGQVWFSVEKLFHLCETSKIRLDRREFMRGLHALGGRGKRQFWYTDTYSYRRTSRIMYPVPLDVLYELRGQPFDAGVDETSGERD